MLGFFVSVNAQTIVPVVGETWQSNLRDPDVSINDVRSSFDLIWPDKANIPRSNGFKPMERWAWWMERRTSSDGIRPTASAWWTNSENRLQTYNQQIGPAWTYEGSVKSPTHGTSGRINRVKKYQNGWLACSPSGGLWVSHDEGANWAPTGVDNMSAVGTTDVLVDPANPDHWFLATGDGDGATTYSIGLLESIDGGFTWQTTGLSMLAGDGVRIHRLTFKPDNSNVIFVSSSTGLYRSNDGGTTFTLVYNGIVRDMQFLPGSSIVAIAAIENIGVVRSNDSGLTWSLVSLPQSGGLGRIEISTCGSDPLRVYAFGANYFSQNTLGLWRSNDGGVTWSASMLYSNTGINLFGWTSDGSDNSGQAWWDMCIDVDPNNADHLLIGGVNLWESNDGGGTWNCDAHWAGQGVLPTVHADQHGLTFLPDGRCIIANDGGVYLRNILGDYHPRFNGLDIAQIYRLGLDPHRHSEMICGTQDNGTNLLNSDGWQRVLDGDGMGCFFHSVDSNILYMSAYYGLLYRSLDEGRSHVQIANYAGSGVNEFGNWLTPWLPSPNNPDVIYVGKTSLHRSNDGGVSWTTLGPMGNLKSDAVALSPTNPSVILVSKREELWRSTNGFDFTKYTNLPGASIGDVKMDRNNPDEIWVAFGSYTPNQQVFNSTDGGVTWVDRSLGLEALPVNALEQTSTGVWFAGTDVGVYIYDPISGWSPYGTSLPLTIITDLEIRSSTNRIVAATFGRGVWQVPLPGLNQVDITALGFNSFNQLQCGFDFECSPEIFNSGIDPITTLKYQIGFDSTADTISLALATPLNSGESLVLPLSIHQVATSGTRTVLMSIIEANGIPDLIIDNNTASRRVTVSGLGYRGTLTEWAGCNSYDISWVIHFENNSEPICHSKPIEAGDSLTTVLCLPEGCLVLQWQDGDGDGWIDAYCGEPGGFELKTPFNELIASSVGVDFTITSSFTYCVTSPWCFADFDGDGDRSVSDLLVLLSDFGCSVNCSADLNGDGLVSISDLMDLLSNYGTSCI